MLRIISYISLVSLASIARCRPTVNGKPDESFSLIKGPSLPVFSPDSPVLEMPSDLSGVEGTPLNIPVASSSDYYPFETTDFNIASGPMCGNPSLASACCSSLFNAGGCQWGAGCAGEQINLCCAQNFDGIPADCEPPKSPSPSPSPRLSIFNDPSFDDQVIDPFTESGLSLMGSAYSNSDEMQQQRRLRWPGHQPRHGSGFSVVPNPSSRVTGFNDKFDMVPFPPWTWCRGGKKKPTRVCGMILQNLPGGHAYLAQGCCSQSCEQYYSIFWREDSILSEIVFPAGVFYVHTVPLHYFFHVNSQNPFIISFSSSRKTSSFCTKNQLSFYRRNIWGKEKIDSWFYQSRNLISIIFFVRILE